MKFRVSGLSPDYEEIFEPTESHARLRSGFMRTLAAVRQEQW